MKQSLDRPIEPCRRHAGLFLVMALGVACAKDSPQPMAGSALGDIPRTIAQTIVEGENAPDRTFEVRNTGACALDFTAVVEGTPWLSIGPLVGTLTDRVSGRVEGVSSTVPTPAPFGVRVAFATAALGRGTHMGTIVIRATCTRNGTTQPADGSPLSIEVSVTVRPYSAVLTSSTDGVYVDPAPITAQSRWRTIYAPGAPQPATYVTGSPRTCWTGREMLVAFVANQTEKPGEFTGGLFDPLLESWRGLPQMNSGATRLEIYYQAIACGPNHMLAVAPIDNGSGPGVGLAGGVYNFTTGIWGGVATFPQAECGGNFRPVSAEWAGDRFVVKEIFNSRVAYYEPDVGRWTCKTYPDSAGANRTSMAYVSGKVVYYGGIGPGGGGDVLRTAVVCDGPTDAPSLTCTTVEVPFANPSRPVWTGARLAFVNGASATSFFDPFAKRWSAFPEGLASPVGPAVAWNGQQLIVWGGNLVTTLSDGGTSYAWTNTGYALHRAAGTTVPLPTAGAPSNRMQPLSVWTGEELLVWNGHLGSENGYAWLNGPVFALR